MYLLSRPNTHNGGVENIFFMVITMQQIPTDVDIVYLLTLNY